MAEVTYLIPIDGNGSLTQIQSQIRGEENGASEFIDSSTANYQGKLTNLVKFKEREDIPKRITLKEDATVPPGTALVWEGEMCVNNRPSDVRAYR